MENYILVRFLGCSWMDKRRDESLAVFRKKPSGDHSKRIQEGVVDTLSRAAESGQFCLAGSASASASELTAMVEWTGMAKSGRREMT